MRRALLILAALVSGAFISAGPALADNPPGTGLHNQSCQALEPFTPGNAANSPGSPFNEPGVNSTNGGTGGAHYSATSQYDVACFQQSSHAARGIGN